MNTKINTVIEALELVIKKQAPLIRQGEDHIWRPAKACVEAATEALSLLRSLPSEQGDGPYTLHESSGYEFHTPQWTIRGQEGSVGLTLEDKALATIVTKALNASHQAGRLSAGLAHTPQVGQEGEGDRHKNGAGLSAPMSPKTETISAAIPVAEEKRCACGLTLKACAMDDCHSSCDPFAG